MRCISLWQPWASAIPLRLKKIETRSWGTKYRGQIAIHAAKTKVGIDELPGDCEGKMEEGWVYGYVGDEGKYCWQVAYCKYGDQKGQGEISGPGIDAGFGLIPFGAIVAVADITACEQMTESLVAMVPSEELAWGDYQPGRFMWMLENVRALKEPIPAKGAQGIWNWDAPANLEELVT